MKQITLRLDDETFAALATEAEKQDRSINWVIRHRLETPGSNWVAPLEIRGMEFREIPTNGPVRLPHETCPHPITRRLGTACGACGKELK